MSSSAAHDCTSALVYRPSYVLPPTSLLQGNNCLYLFFLSYCLSCSWRLFILKSYYCTILSYQVRVCKGNPYEPTAQTGAGSKNSASLSFFYFWCCMMSQRSHQPAVPMCCLGAANQRTFFLKAEELSYLSGAGLSRIGLL